MEFSPSFQCNPAVLTAESGTRSGLVIVPLQTRNLGRLCQQNSSSADIWILQF